MTTTTGDMVLSLRTWRGKPGITGTAYTFPVTQTRAETGNITRGTCSWHIYCMSYITCSWICPTLSWFEVTMVHFPCFICALSRTSWVTWIGWIKHCESLLSMFPQLEAKVTITATLKRKENMYKLLLLLWSFENQNLVVPSNDKTGF